LAALQNEDNSETLVGFGKILKIVSKSQLKTVQLSMDGSSINHDLMKIVHNLLNIVIRKLQWLHIPRVINAV
jgi:hypothetical protein